MRKATIFLIMALALIAATSVQQTALATPPPAGPALRRSRFLPNKFPPPASYYHCSKKTESICLDARSPGPTCCSGACVDTDYSINHCGNCNHACRYPRTCCQGNCVNTFTDKKNCGGCSVKCRTKCTNGYCDYAA